MYQYYVFQIGEADVQKLGRGSEGSEGFVSVPRTCLQPPAGGRYMSSTSLHMSTLVSHAYLYYVFHIGEEAVQELGRCSECSEGLVSVPQTRLQPSAGGRYISSMSTPLSYLGCQLGSRNWWSSSQSPPKILA